MINSNIRGRYKMIGIDTIERYSRHGCELLYKNGPDELVIEGVIDKENNELVVENVDLSTVVLIGSEGDERFDIPVELTGKEKKNHINIVNSMKKDSRLPLSEFTDVLPGKYTNQVFIYGVGSLEAVVSDLGVVEKIEKKHLNGTMADIAFRPYEEIQKRKDANVASFHLTVDNCESSFLDEIEESLAGHTIDYNSLAEAFSKAEIRTATLDGDNIYLYLDATRRPNEMRVSIENERYIFTRKDILWKVFGKASDKKQLDNIIAKAMLLGIVKFEKKDN